MSEFQTDASVVLSAQDEQRFMRTAALRLRSGFVVFMLSMAGCHSQNGSSVEEAKLPYGNVTLGSSLEEVRRIVGSDGQHFEHEKLPFIPLPRELFKAIPESTEWFVWWNEESGIAELTVGVIDQRVIYKHVQRLGKDGKPAGIARILPEYQAQMK